MPEFHTHDRTRLFYIDAGTGRPVVFVASAWLNSRMWELQIPFLVSQGLRCIAYDRRGHGRSDWRYSGYDYDTLADDLAALLDHLDLRDVTLVSHSMGAGEIVRCLTRHGASRIGRIAIVAGTTPFLMNAADNTIGVDRGLFEADLAVRTRDRAKWFADNADSFFGVGLPGVDVSREYAQYMIRECLTCSARATSALSITGFTADLREDLRHITVPTLVVHGDHDRQAPLPLCGARTAALVPGARLLVYENAAHGLFHTHADRLNADILAFVRATSSVGAVVGA